jgi:hypothetical protein
VQTTIQFAKGLSCPEAIPQLFFGHNVPWIFKQDEQHLEWQILNLDPPIIAQQKARSDPCLEPVKPISIASVRVHVEKKGAFAK